MSDQPLMIQQISSIKHTTNSNTPKEEINHQLYCHLNLTFFNIKFEINLSYPEAVMGELMLD